MDTKSITLTDIIAAITNGACDDNLDAVHAAAKDRRKAVGQQAFYLAKIGDRATLRALKPAYLVGAPVTVTSKNRTRLGVKIDPEWIATHPQAARWHGEVTATPAMLDFDRPGGEW